MEALKANSLAHLRHELKTPVNHILGYSELLIEDAAERHLEAFVPVFRQIHSGGCALLESIQTALSEESDSPGDSNLDALKKALRATVADALETSTSFLASLKLAHSQTLSDFDAISSALHALLDFTGEDRQTPQPKPEPQIHLLSSEPALPFEPAQAPSQRGGGGLILIADDDPGNRDLLRRGLECDGHAVVEAGNGLEALAYLRQQPCDLVLLDIMMPDLDGFQTLARLKQDPLLRDLPVIMISALDELGSVVRCIEMGAEDYLPKPFNRVLLHARIGASLEKKWLRDRERRRTEEMEETLRLLEEAKAQLAVHASQDPLTGLANRRFVDAHLEFRMRRENPFSVIYIDLNGFKKINDTYGHQAGDHLLKLVGERLRHAFRSTDIVGRWGGDEFVALVEPGLAGPQANVARVAECFARDFLITVGDSEHGVRMSAAVGVAVWQPGESITDVLHRADAGMYEQKLRNSPQPAP